MESDGGGEWRNYHFGDEVRVEDCPLQRVTRNGWARVGHRVPIVFGRGLKNWFFYLAKKF